MACSVLWDLVKFYEAIDHKLLWKLAREANFPMAVLRLNLMAYKLPRLVGLNGMLAPAQRPARGVVAGCGAATTLVKVLVLKAFDDYLAKHTEISLDSFVDDVQLSMCGKQEEEGPSLAVAALDLAEVLTIQLGATISEQKAAVVASNNQVAEVVRKALGPLSDKETVIAKNLGVDFTSGRHRAMHSRLATRTRRMMAMAPRITKLARLRRSKGILLHKVFVSGIKPQVGHVVEVVGLSPRELHKLRCAAASALPPFGKGRSSNLVHLLHGDKLGALSVACLVRWSSEV